MKQRDQEGLVKTFLIPLLFYHIAVAHHREDTDWSFSHFQWNPSGGHSCARWLSRDSVVEAAFI
jgi:hypothetical protein